MKKLLFSITLLLVAVSMQAQIREFEEMGKIKGVEYTCADQDQLHQMLESGSGIHVPGINIGSWASGLASEILPYIGCVQSLKADNAKAGKKLVKEFDKFIQSHSQEYELLSNHTARDVKMRVYNGVKGGSLTCMELSEDNIVVVAVSGEKTLSEMMDFFKSKFQGRK